jgi:hypothetical protein
VTIRAVAPAIDDAALFVELGLLGQVVGIGMQMVDIRRYLHAFRVVPRTRADAITRVDAAAASRREVGAPVLVAGADCSGQFPAMRIGAIEAAEVGTIAGTVTGQEKAHGRVVPFGGIRQQGRYHRRQSNHLNYSHYFPPYSVASVRPHS